MLENYEYQSDFARKYYGQGLERGHEQGFVKGYEKGYRESREESREEGREEGLRRAVVALVCARAPGLEAQLEEKLRGRSEPELVGLITALGKAQDEAELRAVLDGNR